MGKSSVLASCVRFAGQLDELTGQMPSLVPLDRVALLHPPDTNPLGEIRLAGEPDLRALIGWCEAIGATGVEVADGHDGSDPVALVALGRLGGIPVRILASVVGPLGPPGHRWSVPVLWGLVECDVPGG